ncbi:MAG: hypothetical protein JWN38_1126 [Candidatus Saccharibacteria bacterium]|nr:hypothetical protein [Candidatus Saccharibacteria bacterium]
MSRAGNKKFEECDVKVVELVDYDFDPAVDVKRDNMYIYPATGVGTAKRRLADPNCSTGRYGGTQAKLHCPRTEDERVGVTTQDNMKSRAIAFQELRKQAGEMLCRNCLFSDMSPAEVAISRTEQATAEAALLTAQAARAKAETEYAAIVATAQAELTASQQHILHPEA